MTHTEIDFEFVKYTEMIIQKQNFVFSNYKTISHTLHTVILVKRQQTTQSYIKQSLHNFKGIG